MILKVYVMLSYCMYVCMYVCMYDLLLIRSRALRVCHMYAQSYRSEATNLGDLTADEFHSGRLLECRPVQLSHAVFAPSVLHLWPWVPAV